MNVKDFLATVYCCGTCRHHLKFDETYAEHVRGDEFVCGCPAESTPCDKWEPVEPGPYADVTPVVAAFAWRLVREAEAFDRERRAAAEARAKWILTKTDTTQKERKPCR